MSTLTFTFFAIIALVLNDQTGGWSGFALPVAIVAYTLGACSTMGSRFVRFQHRLPNGQCTEILYGKNLSPRMRATLRHQQHVINVDPDEDHAA